jgi:hypothetical protein
MFLLTAAAAGLVAGLLTYLLFMSHFYDTILQAMGYAP